MAPANRATDDSGFTIVESIIALGLVFVVLVVLLGGLTAGSRGVVASRQRSVAVSLANEVLEDARGRAYGEVGHDFDSDPTLGTDPLITGVAPNQVYTGVSPAEPLAASTVDAGAGGGTNTNPLFPFSPHASLSVRDGTRYTTSVYVTKVTPATGDPYKRISVKVSWTPAQYATAARSVTISTLLFNAVAPPDPALTGLGEADAGTFTVCPDTEDATQVCSLAGVALKQIRLSLPYASGSVDSSFIKSAKGTANSGSAGIDFLSGSPLGCLVPSACDGVKADASADNDTGTAPPDTDEEQSAPIVAGASVTGSVPSITATVGAGSAKARATGRSSWADYPSRVGNDDLLPYFYGEGVGAGTASLAITSLAPTLKLNLLATGPVCTSQCATVEIDREDTGSGQTMTTSSSVKYPSMSLMTLSGSGLTLPGGFAGMVTVTATDARATASSGPGTGGSTVTGSGVTVKIWNGTTYNNNTYSFTAGAQTGATPPVSATLTPSITGLPLLGLSVAMTASAQWNAKVISDPPKAGALTEKSASLSNWLTVTVHTTVKLGVFTVADLTSTLNYGRVAAYASYQDMT